MRAQRFWHVRPARSVALGVVAVLLGLAGAGCVWAGAAATRSGSWPDPLRGWLDRGSELSWSDPIVLGASIVTVILGIVVLACAVVPGRRATVVIEGDDLDAGRELVLSMRAVEAVISGSVERLDGVSDARVRFTGTKARVRVLTRMRETDGIREAAEQRVRSVLAEIPLSAQPKVDLRVTTTGER